MVFGVSAQVEWTAEAATPKPPCVSIVKEPCLSALSLTKFLLYDNCAMLSTVLLYFRNSLVVISGIDPLSSPYEGGAHPSTPYHLNWYPWKELNLHPHVRSMVSCPLNDRGRKPDRTTEYDRQ